MTADIPRQLAAAPAPYAMGHDVFQIIERIYRPSQTPGKPPVLWQVIEHEWRVF